MTKRWYRKPGTPITLEFIYSRVDRSGACWRWLGAKSGKGYGKVRVGRGRVDVHRLVYALVNGPIPDGLQVLHRCDNPICCRPDHLFLGTQSDNMQDMLAKGRNFHQTRPERLARGARNGAYTQPECRRRGERNGRAILAEADVVAVRRLHATGDYLLRDLAARYGVSVATIHRAVRGKAWSYLPSEGSPNDDQTD